MKYSDKSNSSCMYKEPSMYATRVKEQLSKRDNYCDPGKADGQMKGAKSDTQPGPKGSK